MALRNGILTCKCVALVVSEPNVAEQFHLQIIVLLLVLLATSRDFRYVLCRNGFISALHSDSILLFHSLLLLPSATLVRYSVSFTAIRFLDDLSQQTIRMRNNQNAGI